MRKPLVLTVAGVIVVVLAILGAMFVANKREATVENTQQVESSLPSTTLAEYTDSSGISFSYPDDLTVSSAKELDDTTYAQIQITSIDYPGSIIVRAADETAASLDIWVKENAKLASAKSSEESKLADFSAEKFVTNDSTVTAALDQGVLFTVEVFPQKNEAYWTSAYDTVLSSFAIVVPQAAPAAPATGGTTTGADDVIFEGEEIIE